MSDTESHAVANHQTSSRNRTHVRFSNTNFDLIDAYARRLGLSFSDAANVLLDKFAEYQDLLKSRVQ